MTTPRAPLAPHRLGLALSSGSARGWAHLGILAELVARGIRPQVVAGASVGALVGAAYANGRLDDLAGWVCTLTQREVWRLVDATFHGGGVMNGHRLMEAIAGHTGNARIEELPLHFGAVATDLYTGQEVWIHSGPMLSAVRASSGLPGLFAPMWHQDRWMIDGGVVNPLPVSLCRALGADSVIAVDLSRRVTRSEQRALGANAHGPARSSPHGQGGDGNGQAASVEGAAVLSRWAGLVDGLVESFRSRRSEPGLFEVMTGAVNIMQDRLTRDRIAKDAPDVVLRPELDDFQLMDFHRAREAIDAGRSAVQAAARSLERFAAP